VGHAARSDGLLRLAASHDRVSQSGLKIGGGVTTGGARGIIAEIVLRGPFYPKIAVYSVLGHKGIVVFSLLLGPINRIL
jgi:hypothetical protein